MANANPSKDVTTAQTRALDPFSAMRAELDRVFDRFYRGWPNVSDLFTSGEGTNLVPTLDLKDTGNAIVIEAELPGIDEKDITVTVKDGMLTLKGEKKQSKEDKSENRYIMERSYGSFMRSLQLPASIDENKVEAKYDKGLLIITAEKRPEAVKAEKRIEIRKT
jgi:HSP20 family protein